MFVTAADGTYKNDTSDDLWTKLIIVYIIAVGIPHGIAAMHRNNGWEVPLMEGIGNSNVEPSLNPEKAAGVDMEASGAEAGEDASAAKAAEDASAEKAAEDASAAEAAEDASAAKAAEDTAAAKAAE